MSAYHHTLRICWVYFLKIVRFTERGASRIGILRDEAVLDLASADPTMPTDMIEFLEGGKGILETAGELAESSSNWLALSSLRLEVPIARPPKILGVGLNYADHIDETGREAPKVPTIFNKQSTSANGPFDDILAPKESPSLDYEGELGVVIGQRCRRVSRQDAWSVIAGYTVCNDISLREWQRRSPTMTMGKSWDTHCPFGPCIVTSDEIQGPPQLDIKTWVNDDLRQSSNTKHLIFGINVLIEYLTTAFTLEVGDLITTGTSSGVAAAREGQPWLRAGDVCRVWIERIGEIENQVVRDST